MESSRLSHARSPKSTNSNELKASDLWTEGPPNIIQIQPAKSKAYLFCLASLLQAEDGAASDLIGKSPSLVVPLDDALLDSSEQACLIPFDYLLDKI